MIDVQQKADKARDLFLAGYNCAQAVFAAFAEEMGLPEEKALSVASAMGGGIGGLRLTCGAVTGMALVLGALRGYDRPDDKETKQALYARTQRLHAAFVDSYQTSTCLDLLKLNGVAAKATPAERTPEYYKTRPCARYVEKCARLVAEELNRE